jgi:serine/threonine-protein kinase
MPSTALSIGDVISDRYRIDAVLGAGGMGIVYRAEHLHLRKPHALKVLLSEWSSIPEVVARFEREAVAAGNIQSPHVAAATDFGRLPDGCFFLVMEYVEGRTLRRALEAGSMPAPRAMHVLRGIVAALQAAHALGIVHRDLKPENVMLIERDGDPDFVKVLDFGIAKLDDSAAVGRADASSTPLTQLGAVIGTPDYMSPEQALGQPVDARSDLYSAGVVLYEMLTGRCPFEGGAVTMLRHHITGDVPELPPLVADGVDPRLGAILLRLLAKHPDNRFASTAELLGELDQLANERARPPQPPVAPVRRISPLEFAVRHGRAMPSSTRLIAAGAVVLVILVVLVTTLGGHEIRASDERSAGAAATALLPAVALPPASTNAAPLASLPPPPMPSPAPGSSRGASRRTGPGGLYIPPPSQWFK